MAKKLRKSTKSKPPDTLLLSVCFFNSQSTAEAQKEKPYCFSQVDLSFCIVLQDVDS